MSRDLSISSSFDKDLILSKIWLLKSLPRKQFKKVYVLGSWYGNMGIVMRLFGTDFEHIVNVDTNSEYCELTEKIYKLANFDRKYTVLNHDCNYLSLEDADLVINTSTNDISGHKWFRNIPNHCLSAIQCRNNQPVAGMKDRPDTIGQFANLFPLNSVHYIGSLPLKNADEQYTRYLIIGSK